jgi:hypothetical protein
MDEPDDVRIYNLLGQQVHARTLSGLKPGFYLVTVKTAKAVKTKKVFVR